VRLLPATLLLCSLLPAVASAQCAPAPDSAYFFRNLSEQRAEARIAGNRAVYDELLSADFADKQAFIDRELTKRSPEGRPFYAIRDYQLVEHRKGFAAVNYLLIEGTTGGESRAVESRLREVYEVQDGRWKLKTVEVTPAPDDANPARAAL